MAGCFAAFASTGRWELGKIFQRTPSKHKGQYLSPKPSQMLVAQLNRYGVKGNPTSVCSICQRQIRKRRRFPVFLSGNYEGGELRELVTVPGCSANIYLEYQRGCSMRRVLV